MRAYNVRLEFAIMTRRAKITNPTSPRPSQGVGKFGRSRRTRNAEIAGSNPAALTITRHPITTVAMQQWQ